MATSASLSARTQCPHTSRTSTIPTKVSVRALRAITERGIIALGSLLQLDLEDLDCIGDITEWQDFANSCPKNCAAQWGIEGD